jgi:hypothetical protein
MDALAAHQTMSKQRLESEKVRDGLKDLLLGPAQLARRCGSEAALRDRNCELRLAVTCKAMANMNRSHIHGGSMLVLSPKSSGRGYVVNLSPPVADNGIDIVAGRGTLGFDAPRLVVQVTSGTVVVDQPTQLLFSGLAESRSLSLPPAPAFCRRVDLLLPLGVFGRRRSLRVSTPRCPPCWKGDGQHGVERNLRCPIGAEP